MPINGAIWRGKLRIRATASGGVTHSGDGTAGYAAHLNGYTLFAPDVIDVATGFGFYVVSYDNGDGHGVQGTAYYDGPGAPFGGLYCGGGGDAHFEILLDDATLWCRIDGGLPQLDFTLNVIYNGTQVLGPYAYSLVGAGVGPNYVPLLGCMGGDSLISVGSFPNDSFYPPYDTGWSNYASGYVTMAYEAQEEGSSSWLSFPITMLDGTFAVEGSDTSAVTITGYQLDEQSATMHGSYDTGWHYEGSEHYTQQEGAFLCVPGADRSLSRMAPDYRCTLYRSGFPQTKNLYGTSDHHHSQTNGYENPGGSDAYTINRDEVHPSLTAFKGSVGDGYEPVLEPLNYPCYVMTRSNKSDESGNQYANFSGDLQYAITFGSVSDSHYDSFSFPDVTAYNGGVEDYDTNPYVTDWQYHADPVLRYFGSWGSPYWKIGQWFPPAYVDEDEGQVGVQDQWPLDGGGVNPQYWKLARSQWMGEPSAPASERTKKRTDLIGSAVETSGLTLLVDNYWPNGFFRFLGWSRSPVMDCGPLGNADLYERCPNSLTLTQDSKPSWSSSDATLSFDASGVRVTPKTDGQTTAAVSLTLNGWSASPYLYPQTCGSVNVGYSNAGGLDLGFASALGGAATVKDASGTVPFPYARDNAYTGTWGLDYGVVDPTDPPNEFTDDHGVDEQQGGKSYYAMNDPSNAQSIGALTARQPSTLVFNLTLSQDANGKAQSATLGYPTFYRASGTPTVVYLTGATSAILWPNGPCVMYGSEYYWDGLEWNEPPLIAGYDYSPTIIDAIGWRRAFLQGVSPLNGGDSNGIVVPPITTELYDRYSEFEGRAIPQVDQASWTFVLPSADGGIRILLGNTYQELPPIAMFGAPKRAGVNYAKTGQPWGGVYDLCKQPRDIISPVAPLRLYDDEDNLVSSPHAAPLGWCIERYDVAVTNDEAIDWQLKQGDGDDAKTFALVRPYHGWYWAGNSAELRGSLSSDVAGHGRHALAYVTKGAAKLKIASNHKPTDYNEVDPNISADSVCVRWLRDGKEGLRLMYAKDSTIYYTDSHDEGKTFAMPTTIDTGSTPTFIVSRNGLRYVYWLVKNGASYDVKGQIRSGQDKVVKPTFTATTGVDGDGVTVREAFQAQGKHLLILDFVKGGDITSMTSANGVDYS